MHEEDEYDELDVRFANPDSSKKDTQDRTKVILLQFFLRFVVSSFSSYDISVMFLMYIR